MRKIKGVGPLNARIMIVGEVCGAEDEYRGEPLMGGSGHEFTKMLHEAGIPRTECYTTLFIKEKRSIYPMLQDTKAGAAKFSLPHYHEGMYFNDYIAAAAKELHEEIRLVKPNIIIALGDAAMWALTGKSGITSWRGSLLESVDGIKCIPTYAPAQVMKVWEWRQIVVHDLRRAQRESAFPEIKYPPYRFIIRPSFGECVHVLTELLDKAEHSILPLSVDIETRGGHIACNGIAWSRHDAICIPFMCVENHDGYFGFAEEVRLVQLQRQLLTHPNVRVIGQNFLYDTQYFAKHWGIKPRIWHDTMLAHHLLYPGQDKDLGFLASMYCEFHQYWKEEGKEWHTKIPEEQLWTYNCKDAVNTFEIAMEQIRVIEHENLTEPWDFQINHLWHRCLEAMLRGVRIDRNYRNNLLFEFQNGITEREQIVHQLAGFPLNDASPKQMKAFFYDDLGIKPIISRKTKKPTLDGNALKAIAEDEPLLRRLIGSILEKRSMGTLLKNVVMAPLDADGRIRCSYNPGGTETFRLASSESAFGTGTNLQNITSGKKVGLSGLKMPNLRKLFIPDPGYEIGDVDLDRADLQVVAWEANDPLLKEALKRGVDMHILNAYILMGKEPPDLDWLVEGNPEYERIKTIMKDPRQLAKAWCHGTNYGGSAWTMARAAGITVRESEAAQARYFGRYPGIKEWHARTEMQLMTTRTVTNKFGYRRVYFDRPDSVLPEALAWIPQSTVAVVINRGWNQAGRHFSTVRYHNRPALEILLQVHDSLTFQFLSAYRSSILPTLREKLLITVPYEDPLVIPVGLKTSTKSWGDCEPSDWS